MYLKHEGQRYTIPEYGEIHLYPVSKLLEELVNNGIDRTTQSVRKWESKGVIPRSIFKRGRDRLYSKEQIDCIVRCAVECNIRSFHPIKPFIDMMWEELPKVNQMLKERGKKNEDNCEEKTCTESEESSCKDCR